MATTALIGLLMASSSELARGSMVLGGWGVGVGRTDGTVVRGTEILAGVVRGMADAANTTGAADTMDAGDTTDAGAGAIGAAMPEADTRAATPAADFTVAQCAVAVGSMAEQCAAAVDSTAAQCAVAVDSTAAQCAVVEASMAEADSTVAVAIAAADSTVAADTAADVASVLKA